MKKRRNTRKLATFFDGKYTEAYRQLIDELRPFLINPQIDRRNIERLDFRGDLCRGDKKLIWQALARMLQAGGKGRSVMTHGYNQRDLFWWLTGGGHSNIGEKFESLQRRVYEQVKD